MNAQANHRRRRWPRRVLVVFLVLAALYTAYRYTLHRMVEAKLDEIRKQGYPVTLAELDKWYPQVPPDENAASTYIEVFGKMQRPGKEMDKSLPIEGFGDLPEHGKPMPDEMKKVISDYLAMNEETLRLLRKAAIMRHCRFEMAGSDRRVQHGAEIRQAVRLLALEAILQAENQQPAKVTDSISCEIGVVRSLADEPGVIALLLRVACQGLVKMTIEQSLNRISLDANQLSILGTKFAESEDEAAVASALAGEWAGTEQFFAAPVGDRLCALMASDVSLYKLFLYEYAGLREFDHVRVLQLISQYVTAAKLPLSERLKVARSVAQRAEQSSRWAPFTQLNTVGLPLVMRHDARRIAYGRLCEAAIAVEEYRLARGKLPETISALAPKAIPLDPFTGQPLRYKRLAKGYAVYSVGEDGKDDGGDEKKDITFTVER
jgi:hypothetical protein